MMLNNQGVQRRIKIWLLGKYLYFYHMKKVLLVFSVMLICATMEARQAFGTDIGIGLKGGLNFNKVVGPAWKDQFSTDPHAGFFMFINKVRFGVHIEAMWTQNHMVADSTFYGLYRQYYNNVVDSLSNGSFRFSTLSIPLLLNVKLTQFLWMQVGPQYSANLKVHDVDGILRQGIEVVKEGNFNLVGGLWLQFGGKAPLLRMNAGLRYVSGINNLSNIRTIAGSQAEWKNKLIQAHIGINF
jgi:hypothetical protein